MSIADLFEVAGTALVVIAAAVLTFTLVPQPFSLASGLAVCGLGFYLLSVLASRASDRDGGA